MTTANKLTILRVLMIPAFLAVLYWGFPGSRYVALAIYVVACLTDLLDGYIARHYNQISDFGKFMDPLADKCLTTAAFIYMVACGICSPVVLAVILFREFAVAGVRMLAAETGTVIAANMWGKVKTVLQMLTVLYYYFAGALAGPTDIMAVSLITQILCWLCGAATLLSGGIYLWQNRKLFMQAK